MLKIEKKQVKIVSVIIAALFVLGIVGVAVSQSGTSYAAGSSSSVGVVDYEKLITQHPDYPKIEEAWKVAVTQAQKDFEAKSASMNDKEKQAYSVQLQQGLANKHKELSDSIDKKVKDTIKAVADSKGITVVVTKAAVIYGGQDITDDVIKKYSGK